MGGMFFFKSWLVVLFLNMSFLSYEVSYYVFVENLLPEQVLCYHAQLLDRWAAILTEEPAVSLDMVQVILLSS